MQINLELPDDMMVLSRKQLKDLIGEMQAEIAAEKMEVSILTIAETAEILKVSVPTVRRWIEEKDIPYFQHGQVIRLNKYEVLKWINCKNKA